MQGNEKFTIFENHRVTLGVACVLTGLMSVILGGGGSAVWTSWFVNFVPLLYLSMAAALIISAANVDIATGPVMGLTGMIIVYVAGFADTDGYKVLGAHLLAGAICLLVYYTIYRTVLAGISSLIVTLAVAFVARGAATILQVCRQGEAAVCSILGAASSPAWSSTLPEPFVVSMLATPPGAFFLTGLLVGTMYLFRYRSRRGLDHIAVGADARAARYAGVSINRVHRTSFWLAGFLVLTATLGRLHAQQNGGWAANIGWGDELIGIAVAVIGGTRINGGRFDPVAVALAAFLVYSVRDVITNDLRFPAEAASALFGTAVITIAWLDRKTGNKE